MRAKARLEDLFVTRVDAVSAPANRRRFLMLKEEEVKDMPETTVQELEGQGLTAEQKDKIKRALELLYPLFEEGVLPDTVIAILAQLVGYPLPEGVKPYPYPKPYPAPAPQASEGTTKETEAVVCETQPEGSEVSAEAAPKAAAEEPAREEEVPASAPVAKAAEPSIELEELRKTREELEALKKALAEERAAREKREFEEAIKSEMPSLLTLAPDLVDVLFSLQKSGNTKTLESLKKLEAVIAASPLFKELGSQGPAEESPWDVLDREARELLEKGEAKTIEAARVMILSKNPELYKKLRG